MKNILTLCIFILALFLGTASATAQSNKIEVNKLAAEKTEALRQVIKFNDDQRDEVYEAIKEYTQATLDLQKVEVVEEGVEEKIKTLLNTKLQAILTDEQFERFQSFALEQQ